MEIMQYILIPTLLVLLYIIHNLSSTKANPDQKKPTFSEDNKKDKEARKNNKFDDYLSMFQSTMLTPSFSH